MSRTTQIAHRLDVRQIISLGMVLLMTNPLLMSGAPVPQQPASAAPANGKQQARRAAPAAPLSRPVSRPPAPIAPQVPATLTGQSQTLLPDGRTLLLGGAAFNGVTAAISIRNPQSSAVTPIPALLRHARAYHTATLLPDGTVLVLGGLDAAGLVAEAEIFDSVSLTSAPLSSSPLRARAYHTATVLTDGRVLIAGGTGGAGQIIAEAEIWDPRSNAIQQLPPLSAARRSHTATLLASGNVALWGGTGDTGPRTDGDLFDPGSGAFTKIDAIPADLPPQSSLAGSIPIDGAIGVSAGSAIALRLSIVIRVSSASPATVSLASPERAVPAKIVPAEAGRLIFLTPEEALQPGTKYIVALQGLLDLNNAPIASAEVSFTTAGSAPLAITANAPASNPNDPMNTPALQAPPGVTALSGWVWSTQNNQPISGVTLDVNCGSQEKTVQSDSSGLFLISGLPSGHCVLKVDGLTAGNNGRNYGLYFIGVDIKAGQTNVLNYVIWLTPIDEGHDVTIPSPTTSDTVVTTPLIKGLDLHLTAGTTIVGDDGKTVTQLSITAIPLKQPPFPLPDVSVVFYFTVQPGGAYVDAPNWAGAQLYYPNIFHSQAGARYDFWNYDPNGNGWYIYGHGSVSADGKQIVPDPGVVLYRLTGAMTAQPTGAPPNGPNPNNPQPRGDPVDAGTGLFVHTKTDLYLPDVIPVSLTRTYRQGDSAVRTFGIGTNLNYDMFLVGDRFPYTYMDLIQADGSRVHFQRISAHTDPPNQDYLHALYENGTVPGPFFKAQIKPGGVGWSMVLTDGTIMTFPAADLAAAAQYRLAALATLQDRHGNSVTIERNNGIACSVPTGYCPLTKLTTKSQRWIKLNYDSTYRVTSAQDNIGRTVQYIYDSGGRLATVTDANGGTTQYTYDKNDQMLTITDPNHTPWLTNVYDNAGRVTSQTLGQNGEGGAFTYVYAATDSSGNITETDVTDPSNNVEKITFDTSRSYFSGGPPSAMVYPATGLNPSFGYASSTNLVQTVSDGFRRTTTRGYDSFGNVTSIAQSPSGVTTTIAYVPATSPPYNLVSSITVTGGTLTRTTTFTYDSHQNLQSVTSPSGTVNVTTNLDGTVGTMSIPLVSSQLTYSFTYTGGVVTGMTTSPPSGSFTSTVDGAGRVLNTTDALGNITRYEYNRLNSLLSITDPAKGMTTLTYDGNGNLLSVTDAVHASTPTTYTYDSMDRLKTRTDPLLRQESYTYYSNGNINTLKDRKSQTTTFSFDSLNRLTGAQFQDNSTIGYVYDSKGRIQYINDSIAGQIARTYDNLDLLTSETTPLGVVSYVNDALGRRSSMTTPGQTALTYGYDSGDRLNQITQGSTSVSMTYDTAGRRSTLTLPNGIVATYGYDTSSRLASINYDKSGTHVGDLSYGYDTIGRRTSMGGTLARVSLPAATTALAAYNVNNQLTSWNGTTLSYDLNGNMSNDGIRAFGWNARNQLASIGTTTFQYDGTGRRSPNGAGVGFVYDGLNPVQEIVSGSPRANLVTGGLDEIFARTDSGGTSSVLTDALGSTLALADSTATVQTQYTFDPFGNTTSTGAASTNAFQYTGRENDGSGMYYYRARYYNATLQRFISEDPIEFGGGDANLYAYTSNAPTDFVDPSGMQEAIVIGCAIGGPVGCAGGGAVDLIMLGGAVLIGGATLIHFDPNNPPQTWPDPQNPPGVPHPSGKPGTWIDPDGDTWRWHDDPTGAHGPTHWDLGFGKGSPWYPQPWWWPKGGKPGPKPPGKNRGPYLPGFPGGRGLGGRKDK